MGLSSADAVPLARELGARISAALLRGETGITAICERAVAEVLDPARTAALLGRAIGQTELCRCGGSASQTARLTLAHDLRNAVMGWLPQEYPPPGP